MTFLKKTLRNNDFPEYFIGRCIKLFLDKVLTTKNVKPEIPESPKKEVRICLPFLEKISLETRSKLQKLFSESFPSFKLQVIFKSQNRLRNLFNFKDKIPLSVRSLILYQYTCDICNDIYIGKTKRHYRVRNFEHLGISLLTHKPYTYNPTNGNNTAILNHIIKIVHAARTILK